MILNPTGVVEPAHLGQMFFDPATEVFYQARGRTAADWHLVAPSEMVGSFVKMYDFFLGPIGTEPKGEDAERFTKDSAIVAATMAVDGITILRTLQWRAVQDQREVCMVRIKIARPKGLSIFIGFAADPVPHSMPTGSGFHIEDEAIWFGDERCRDVEAGKAMLFLIEAGTDWAWGSIDGDVVGVEPVTLPATKPVIAVFSRIDGPRVYAAGYDRILERRMKK